MGFIIKILLIVFLLSYKVITYQSYQFEEIDFSLVLNKNNQIYYVLFYLEDCLSCEGVKEYIVKSEKYRFFNLFCVNLIMVEENNRRRHDNNIGVNNYQDIHVSLTPTLIEITSSTITNQIEGYVEIVNFLNG